MSLHDPARRPWATRKGARAVALSAWAVVAVSALLAAFWWVGTTQGDRSTLTPAIVAFNVSVFVGIGALAVDLLTTQRRGLEESTALPRLPGAWFTGAGFGTIAAAVLPSGHDAAPLPWGLLIAVGGALVFISPCLLERYRDGRTHRHAGIRASGIRTIAMVTDVHTFFREHYPRYRVTMRFTDQHGTPRWFTQTAPSGSRAMEAGQHLPLHYDAANPGRRRTLVVDWPTWS